MNQSMGANSFEKSLFGSDWQEKSTNEIWKASYSSSQANVRNTNQVYENLLRICEEIDAALPEIQSTVNKGGLHINEHKFLPENRILQDPFLQAFDVMDTGTSLEDIQIYEDILNGSAMMWNNESSNFHIQQRNIADTLYSEPVRSTYDACFQFQSTQVPHTDQRPIFAENEIEQYMINQRFNFNKQNFPNTTVHESRKDVEDSLQLWRKLNYGTSEVPTTRPEELNNDEALDLSVKPTKSVLAILDFTMPSLSSSASSSPEQRDIDHDTSTLDTPKMQSPTPHPTAEPELQKNCAQGLPILVGQPEITTIPVKPVKKKKEKKKSSKRETRKLLQQDLVLSSSSDESSLPAATSSTHKKMKLTLQKPVADERSFLSHLKDCIKIKKTRPKKSSTDSPTNPKSITSPTLKAGAAYIEQQLSMIPDEKSARIPYKHLPKKNTPVKPVRRRSKEQIVDQRYNTRLSIKPKSKSNAKQNNSPGLPSLSSDENNNRKYPESRTPQHVEEK